MQSYALNGSRGSLLEGRDQMGILGSLGFMPPLGAGGMGPGQLPNVTSTLPTVPPYALGTAAVEQAGLVGVQPRAIGQPGPSVPSTMTTTPPHQVARAGRGPYETTSEWQRSTIKRCERAQSAPCHLRGCFKPLGQPDIEDTAGAPACGVAETDLDVSMLVGSLRTPQDERAQASGGMVGDGSEEPSPIMAAPCEPEVEKDMAEELEEEQVEESESSGSETEEEEETMTKEEVETMVKDIVHRELRRQRGIIAKLEERVDAWECWGNEVEKKMVGLTSLVERLQALVENQARQPPHLLEQHLPQVNHYQGSLGHTGLGQLATQSHTSGLLGTGANPSNTGDYNTYLVGAGSGPVSLVAQQPLVRYQVNGLEVEMSPARPRELQWGTPSVANTGNCALVPQQLGATGSVAHIRSVGSNFGKPQVTGTPSPSAAMVASTNPLLLALQQNVKAPYLDPMEADSWPQFVREWEAWSKWYLVHKPPGPDGEAMHRALLVSRLHHTLQERYNEEIVRHPDLSFQAIWNDLARNYGVDNPHFWRSKWEKVRLHLVDGELTLANWKLYQSKFETALSKVSDWTESEVTDRVLRQLPAKWVSKVMAKEGSKAKEKFILKVENCPCDPQTLGQVLVRAVGNFKNLVPMKGCTLVEFPYEAQVHALLSMVDFSIGGTRLGLSQVRAGWGAADIFAYVSEELRVAEESDILKRSTIGRSFQVRKDKEVRQAIEEKSARKDSPHKDKDKEANPKSPYRGKGGRDGKHGDSPKSSPHHNQKGTPKGKGHGGGKGHDGKGHGRGGGSWA